MPTIKRMGAAGILVALSIAMFSCGVRAGNIVLIPSQYEGWVAIRYDVKGAPVLAKDGIKTVINVPSSGVISTSNARPNGYGIDTYYAVSPQGTRTRLRAEADSCKANERCVRQFQFFTSPAVVTVFFVGTAQDLSRFPKPTISASQ